MQSLPAMAKDRMQKEQETTVRKVKIQSPRCERVTGVYLRRTCRHPGWACCSPGRGRLQGARPRLRHGTPMAPPTPPPPPVPAPPAAPPAPTPTGANKERASQEACQETAERGQLRRYARSQQRGQNLEGMLEASREGPSREELQESAEKGHLGRYARSLGWNHSAKEVSGWRTLLAASTSSMHGMMKRHIQAFITRGNEQAVHKEDTTGEAVAFPLVAFLAWHS